MIFKIFINNNQKTTRTVRVGAVCIPSEHELDLVGSKGQGHISPECHVLGKNLGRASFRKQS